MNLPRGPYSGNKSSIRSCNAVWAYTAQKDHNLPTPAAESQGEVMLTGHANSYSWRGFTLRFSSTLKKVTIKCYYCAHGAYITQIHYDKLCWYKMQVVEWTVQRMPSTKQQISHVQPSGRFPIIIYTADTYWTIETKVHSSIYLGTMTLR